MYLRIITKMLVFCVLCGSLVHTASGWLPLLEQQGYCDPGLKQDANNPNGYRVRGDRCEGIYIQEVASTTLEIASFTESFETLDPASRTSLVLEWQTPQNEPVHVRGKSLRRKLYYQMDTLRPAGVTSYGWPPTMLSTLGLRNNELGVKAWISLRLENTSQSVHLPLRIRQQAPASGSGNYQILLVPGAELSEVYLSLAPVKSDGRLGQFLSSRQPLKYGFYPAERSITIKIPKPKTPGIYYLEIGATLRAGGSSSTKLWFYHAN